MVELTGAVAAAVENRTEPQVETPEQAMKATATTAVPKVVAEAAAVMAVVELAAVDAAAAE